MSGINSETTGGEQPSNTPLIITTGPDLEKEESQKGETMVTMIMHRLGLAEDERERNILLGLSRSHLDLQTEMDKIRSSHAIRDDLESEGRILASIANSATFLGLLQVGFMAFAGPTKLPTAASNAYLFFSYLGLLLDISVAVSAIIAAASRSLAVSVSARKSPTNSRDSEKIKALKDLAVPSLKRTETLSVLAQLKKHNDKEKAIAESLNRSFAIVSPLDLLAAFVGTVYGVVFLFISIVIFMANAADRAVWIPIVVVGVIIFTTMLPLTQMYLFTFVYVSSRVKESKMKVVGNGSLAGSLLSFLSGYILDGREEPGHEVPPENV